MMNLDYPGYKNEDLVFHFINFLGDCSYLLENPHLHCISDLWRTDKRVYDILTRFGLSTTNAVQLNTSLTTLEWLIVKNLGDRPSLIFEPNVFGLIAVRTAKLMFKINSTCPLYP